MRSTKSETNSKQKKKAKPDTGEDVIGKGKRFHHQGPKDHKDHKEEELQPRITLARP